MWYRSVWLLILGAALNLNFTVRVCGEIRIVSKASPLEVVTERYRAQVEGDGCLTSLMVEGHEFLAANVSISRGSYFYHAGPLKLAEIKQKDASTIFARGERTSVEYQFADEEMAWTLTNHGDEELVFFVVFSGFMEGYRKGPANIRATPITADANRLSCFMGGVRIDIEGLNRIWGPWQGPHQVGQVNLKPGDTTLLKFRIGEATEDEKEEIVHLHAFPAEPELVVLSPRNYEVIQRQTISKSEVLVSGRCNVDANEIELRVQGESAFGKLSGDWIKVPVVSPLREFNRRVRLPAGGWYSLDVRAMHGGKVVAEQQIERFGVGEVFVGAGQSNSTNSGEFKTQQTTGMVSSFGGESWQLADDPQPGVADRTQGGSFWPAFGDAMYRKYRVPIGVATTGYGGTSVNQWQPEGGLFTHWMMTRVHQLGPRGFRALLWHQGESDVEMAEEEYYHKLKKVIVASRAKAGWEFPWFVAQASYHSPEKTSFDNIRSAQQRLWNDGVALAGPDTDILTGDHRDMGGKGIHLSPKGLKAHGKMWAEQVGAYLDEVLAVEK